MSQTNISLRLVVSRDEKPKLCPDYRMEAGSAEIAVGSPLLRASPSGFAVRFLSRSMLSPFPRYRWPRLFNWR
jgi:hypothetical protein